MVYEENAAIGPSRRNLLKKGLLTGFGLAAAAVASPIFTGAAQATSLQNGWYYCLACKELFHGDGTSTKTGGVCGALSGNFDKIPHEATVTFNYILSWDVSGTAADPQPGWFWCQKCWSLFHGGNSRTAGICPLDYKAHYGSRSWAYSLYYDSPNNGQPGWYWCNNCSALFYGGSSTQAGNCPATDLDLGPHKAPITYHYNIAY